MKLRPLGFCILVLILFGLAVFSITGPGPDEVTAGPLDPAVSGGTATQDYLIPLSVPDPATINVPPGAMPWHAGVLVQTVMAEQAQPLLQELDGLAARGKIFGYHMAPELNAVRVTAWRDSVEAASLATVLGADAAVPAEAGGACAAQGAEALEAVVRARIEGELLASLAPQAAARTNPSIDLAMASGSPGGTAYSYIYGSTDPQASVAMRVLRGGAVAASQTSTSGTDGSYAFYPSYSMCSSLSRSSSSGSVYLWSLQPGDVVEISVAGRTASTVVTTLAAWMDPLANVVAGSTASGRSMEIAVSQPSPQDRCSVSAFTQAVATNGAGSFSTNWGGQVDFDHSASSRVCARDAAGNGPCLFVPAFYVGLSPQTLDPARPVLIGQIKPGASCMVRQLRNGEVVGFPSSCQASSSGSVSLSGLYESLEPGDVVQLSSDGMTLEYTFSSLSASLDYAGDRLTGKASPGRRVTARLIKRGLTWASAGGLNATSCGSSMGCRSAVADGEGNFSVVAPFDVARGDYAHLVTYDAAGNFQESMPVNAPAIFAELTRPYVAGYWAPPGATGLAVRVLGANSVVKASGSASVSTWDGSFLLYLPDYGVISGDRVQVEALGSGGPVLQNMTVQALTARLDSDTGRLTGSSPGGHFIAVPGTERCDPAQSGLQPAACVERDLPAGSYDVAFPAWQLRGGDWAHAYLVGPDGNYTERLPDGFQVRFDLGSNYIMGSTETAGASVTATLSRGGLQVGSCAAYSWGYWYACNVASASAVLPGDTVRVTTTDGDEALLLVPKLTANGGEWPARVFGESPANELVVASGRERARVDLGGGSYQIAGGSYPAPRPVWADANGRYSASYSGVSYRTTASASICLPARPASPCAVGSLDYCYPAGHVAYYSSPDAETPPPDAYEPDNAQGDAKLYTGPQHHSFANPYDIDWVQFDVPAQHVADRVSYSIGTYNLASGALHDMTLLTADGQTVVRQWRVFSQEGVPSTVTWRPEVAGVFYLRIERPSNAGPIFCGDVYDLSIRAMSRPVYLPVIVR